MHIFILPKKFRKFSNIRLFALSTPGGDWTKSIQIIGTLPNIDSETMIVILTHETMHHILLREFGLGTTYKLDNIDKLGYSKIWRR